MYKALNINKRNNQLYNLSVIYEINLLNLVNL